MEQTAVQKAIEKIDEQIEIAQACRIEASKVRDETSTSRHHGMKISLVAFRQELINLLELEKLKNHSEYMRGWYNGFNSKEIENLKTK
jgi:hypothetical protein